MSHSHSRPSSPDKEAEVRQVEEDNRMEDGSILHARWIKPPQRQLQGQTCGHTIFVISNPATVNKVLTDGLLVCQKCVYAEKCKKEPTRCLKCHGWGHLSYDCTQQYDMCGTCASWNHTPDCKDGGQPRCISCQTVGHPSWDRKCPVFIHKCEELDDRLTENYMPYFPTNEAWTHVSWPSRPARQNYRTPIVANGMGLGPQRSGYRQSTLNFPTVQCQPQVYKRSAATSEAMHREPATGANGLERGQPHRWADGIGADEDSPPPSPLY